MLPTYRAAVIVGVSLAVVTPGDALVYLTFQQGAQLSPAAFPLLAFGAATVLILAAGPVGRVADRVGRLRVFIVGEALLVGVLLVLLSGAHSVVALVAMLVLLGGYYAATDGVLAALASSEVDASARARAMAVLATGLALGKLVASVAFGALWSAAGSTLAVEVFLVGLGAALFISVTVLRRSSEVLPA